MASCAYKLREFNDMDEACWTTMNDLKFAPNGLTQGPFRKRRKDSDYFAEYDNRSLRKNEPAVTMDNITTELLIDRLLKFLTIYTPVVLFVLVAVYGLMNNALSCAPPANFTTETGATFINNYCTTWLSTANGEQGDDRLKASNTGFLIHRYVPGLLLMYALTMTVPHLIWYLAKHDEVAAIVRTVIKEYDHYYGTLVREMVYRKEILGETHFDFTELMKDLPKFESSRADWLLNSYLVNWQKSTWLRNAYLMKHALSAVLHLLAIALPAAGMALATKHQTGSILLANDFHCRLREEFRTESHVYCTLPQTPFLNTVICLLVVITCLALLSQLVYFAFYLYCPRCSRELPSRFMEDNFFGSYIILSAFSKHAQKYHLENIEHLYVNISPRLVRTDFHLISLFCDVNLGLFNTHYVIKHWVTEKFMAGTRRQVLELKHSCYPVEPVDLDFDLLTVYA